MNYIENIYICLAAPLLIAILCMRGNRRRAVVFLLAGMSACLLSSYVSTFLSALLGAATSIASVEISPMVEECIKLVPVLFYLLVFEPKRRNVSEAVLMVAIGFATFENVCYLLTNEIDNILYLLIRGFGTGAAHVICGVIIAIGLLYIWDRAWLRAAGTFGLLCVAMNYHAIYNLLVSQSGVAAIIGYLIPIITTLIWVIFGKRQVRDNT